VSTARLRHTFAACRLARVHTPPPHATSAQQTRFSDPRSARCGARPDALQHPEIEATREAGSRHTPGGAALQDLDRVTPVEAPLLEDGTMGTNLRHPDGDWRILEQGELADQQLERTVTPREEIELTAGGRTETADAKADGDNRPFDLLMADQGRDR